MYWMSRAERGRESIPVSKSHGHKRIGECNALIIMSKYYSFVFYYSFKELMIFFFIFDKV